MFANIKIVINIIKIKIKQLLYDVTNFVSYERYVMLKIEDIINKLNELSDSPSFIMI